MFVKHFDILRIRGNLNAKFFFYNTIYMISPQGLSSKMELLEFHASHQKKALSAHLKTRFAWVG
jgi:hypothetical protein